MPFQKTVKSSAYFSRFQVKPRRRREGKTDYYARRRLVGQAKNKYNSPKYRLVVRITNRQVIVQVVYAKLQGDFTLTQASSKELPRYGIEHGLTNFTAAYATGLLAARRALQILKLDEKYEGVVEPTGELELTEALGDDEPRPFKCYLDVGLRRTSTGSRVFGAMKGASDGGIYIPHNEKRFPGYDPESKSLDAEVLQKYIVGGHVAEYMESLEEEDDERFKKQFSTYLASDVGSADIEEIYTSAYASIREDPSFKASEKDVAKWTAESNKFRARKLNREQRRERVDEKIAAYKAGKVAVESEEEDDE
ncbi:large subunit ribosomal protein L5e, partial [Tremellales sp. Uapishka_1]